ncbi:uncharacterized protein RCC_11412 [Ramularia collo-cygni]|uniref:F-box domain-containing protein n=1 Tax=Ramularia collo-cygni TaxID=112498 RepID=A0A2D3VSQ7_9PEZI|nr:uncharacterized protein RCC_11412 [Ramularia collo-cygni]CZT25743.1 uncharacterized protein RCC_11412 [Ramularia collo-cygni]
MTANSSTAGIMSTVASQIFTLPEILENILLGLPVLDLLLAQRVDKTFHGVINSSIHIKRALFFETRVQAQREKDANTPPKINPLLSKMLPKDMSKCLVDFTGELDKNREEALQKVRDARAMPLHIRQASLPMVFNTLTCKEMDLLHCLWLPGRLVAVADTKFHLHLPYIYEALLPQTRQPMPVNEVESYEKASWRRMYPTNVPVEIHGLRNTIFCNGLNGVLVHAERPPWGNMDFLFDQLHIRH